MALGRQVAALVLQVERTVGGLEGVGMHGLVREKKRERLRAPPLEELDREPVEQIGDVAGALLVGSVDVQLRVLEAPMAVERDPVVVTRPRPAVVAHVPLADVRGLVAELLQREMVVGQAMAHRVARDVVDDPVPARVLAGHDRRPVGRADRRRMERALEYRALMRDAVDVRRLQVRMTAGAELVVAQVVDQDDEEIGLPHPY